VCVCVYVSLNLYFCNLQKRKEEEAAKQK